MVYSTVQSVVNAQPFIRDAIQTTVVTKTVIQTIPVPTDSALIITCWISGIKSDGSLAANGEVTASYKNDGGTVTEQNFETGEHFEFPAGWNFAIDISGTDIKPSVTGAAATTINWEIKSLVSSAKV